MTSKSILREGETAEVGQQLLNYSNGFRLWDAVFRRKANGSVELLAYVEGADVAEFFANALNQQQQASKQVVHILHQGWPLCNFSTKVPGEWPPNHVWAYRGNPQANCPQCLEADKKSSELKTGESKESEQHR